MKEFQIWSEGFSMGNKITRASYMGISRGASFHEACDYFFRKNPRYNSSDITHWGCRLFEDEKSARSRFG